MKYSFVALLGMFLLSLMMSAHEPYEIITARPGDGIFSILRDHGMNPSKYYAEFVALNRDNLINVSELHVGREYRLPYAPDSFKNMGRFIQVPNTSETPIFENRLSELRLKSTDLQNAVYYLIKEQNANADTLKKDDFIDDITLNLARRLLENGARVYILAPKKNTEKQDGMMVTQEYVSEINKRYIRHSQNHQRLLLVKSNGSTAQKNIDVLVSYHTKSRESQRFASSIQNAFQSSNNGNKVPEKKLRAFVDKKNVFLAKNTLPALSVIELGESADENQTISVQKNEDDLARYLTKGIYSDYAELKLEE